jgi:enamine deaminase RidA (YjgF/YER057c/UK114 family)
MKQVLFVPGVSRPGAAFSAVVTAAPGRMVFISGLLARDAAGKMVGKGDIAAQTRQICENLQHCMMVAGGSLADLTRLDVFVTDISQREQVYAVRRTFFPSDPPASTMVEVSAFTEADALIEINAIGVI